MSKLSVDQENPLEIMCYKFAEIISPTCKQLNLTPNHLTTISNVGALAALYCIYHKRHTFLFVLGVVIKYLFDCADGYYARRYKMTSKFGDVYDHVSDFLFFLFIFLFAITQYTFAPWAYPYRGYLLAILIILIMLNVVHMGCQENIYAQKTGKQSTATLSIFQKACPNPNTYIKYTRWIGSPVISPILVIVSILFVLV